MLPTGPSQKPLSDRIKQVEGQISQKESDIQRKQQELDGLATDVKAQASAIPKVTTFIGRLVQFIRTSPRLNFLHSLLFRKSETFREEIIAQKLNQAEHEYLSRIWDTAQRSIRGDKGSLENEKTILVKEMNELKRQEIALKSAIPHLFSSAEEYLALPPLDITNLDLHDLDPRQLELGPVMRFEDEHHRIGFIIRGALVRDNDKVIKPRVQVFIQDLDNPKSWITNDDEPNDLMDFYGGRVLHNGTPFETNKGFVTALKTLLKEGETQFTDLKQNRLKVKLVQQQEMQAQQNQSPPGDEFPDFSVQ